MLQEPFNNDTANPQGPAAAFQMPFAATQKAFSLNMIGRLGVVFPVRCPLPAACLITE
jgi:hypothetical protein